MKPLITLYLHDAVDDIIPSMTYWMGAVGSRVLGRVWGLVVWPYCCRTEERRLFRGSPYASWTDMEDAPLFRD